MGQYRPDLGTELAVSRTVTTGDMVRATLRGKRFRPGDYLVQGLLFATLLIALAVLVILIADVVDRAAPVLRDRAGDFVTSNTRSEEHTSELQSRPHLVCRLLLEKKK